MKRSNPLEKGAGLKLATLSDEFDALLVRMQSPEVGKAMKNAFGASPSRIGKAAVLAARKLMSEDALVSQG